MDKKRIIRILETITLLVLPGVVGYITAKQQREDMCETVREYLDESKLIPESTTSEES